MNPTFGGQNAPSSDFLGQLGWKYYNSIKKKAMEQEFSWTGLTLSMSIAFFIIIGSAFGLSLAYRSITDNNKPDIAQDGIYYLESAKRIESSKLV